MPVNNSQFFRNKPLLKPHLTPFGMEVWQFDDQHVWRTPKQATQSSGGATNVWTIFTTLLCGEERARARNDQKRRALTARGGFRPCLPRQHASSRRSPSRPGA